MSEEDGITFELKQKDASTLLHVRQGDFSALSDGQKYWQMSAEVWDHVLPRIKKLAEAPAENF